MKKNLSIFLVMFALFSCSSSDDGEDNTGETPIPSTTGAITKDGVNFSESNLKCEKIVFASLESTVEHPATMTLQFNDNVEVIIKGVADTRDTKESDKVYRMLKNCISPNGSITINLKDGNKIVSSETFTPPTTSWWKIASDDSYFTIDFNFKGEKYSYWGQIKYVFPEEPTNPTEPEEPEEPENPTTLNSYFLVGDENPQYYGDLHTTLEKYDGYDVVTVSNKDANFPISFKFSYTRNVEFEYIPQNLLANKINLMSLLPKNDMYFREGIFNIKGVDYNIIKKTNVFYHYIKLTRRVPEIKLIAWEYELSIEGNYNKVKGVIEMIW